MSFLNYYWRRAIRRSRRIWGSEFEDVDSINGREILKGAAGSSFVRKLLEQPKPAFIGRVGTVEAGVLEYYLSAEYISKAYLPRSLRLKLSNNAGFFPATSANVSRFVDGFRSIGIDMDSVGCRTRAVFGNYMELESSVVNGLCPQATPIDLDVLYEPLGPYFGWTDALAGRKVLVVHPFAELIERQYEGRSGLRWNVSLPDFELLTLIPPLTLADSGDRTRWASWFEALHSTKEAMTALDYDVALIGAGAYGPFLAHHAKLSGRIGINVGGALQLYFQIAGQRWLDPDSPSYLGVESSEFWVRPPREMRPEGFEKVEGGCYW